MSQDRWSRDPTEIVPEGFVFPGTEVLDPREVFAAPGYQAPRQRADGAAVAALVLALLSPIPGAGLVGALLGAWALRRLRGSYRTGTGLAWFAVVIGTAATAAWLWLWWLLTRTM